MCDSKPNNKLIGVLGIIFGLLCLGSFLVIDRSKLIIPVSNLFLVKYSIIICIINAGLFFTVAGVLISLGIFVPGHDKMNIEYKEIKAKGTLLSAFILSPFLLSFFTTIFVMSESVLWKILGSLALIYIAWVLYSNVRVLKIGRKTNGKS
jgi:hypothetical protein